MAFVNVGLGAIGVGQSTSSSSIQRVIVPRSQLQALSSKIGALLSKTNYKSTSSVFAVVKTITAYLKLAKAQKVPDQTEIRKKETLLQDIRRAVAQAGGSASIVDNMIAGKWPPVVATSTKAAPTQPRIAQLPAPTVQVRKDAPAPVAVAPQAMVTAPKALSVLSAAAPTVPTLNISLRAPQQTAGTVGAPGARRVQPSTAVTKAAAATAVLTDKVRQPLPTPAAPPPAPPATPAPQARIEVPNVPVIPPMPDIAPAIEDAVEPEEARAAIETQAQADSEKQDSKLPLLIGGGVVVLAAYMLLK